ncbi:sulfatase domain protein [Phlyctema vagabunda]|uniref:Sulfatase domain protein n=1 Tax=Phlyctema vagabunda TaxID=108571 RepID=A0ABR4PCA4_9HELO
MSVFCHSLSRLWRSPFQYSILCTALISSKTVHLYNHLTSLPPLFVLYLPTFFAIDIVLAGFFWVLVHLRPHGRKSLIVAFVVNILCLVMLASASLQIAFYLETGGEIKWGTGKALVSDPAALKLLASGSLPSLMVCTAILTTARIFCRPLYGISRVIASYTSYAITGRHLTRRTELCSLEEALGAEISLLERNPYSEIQRRSVDSLETDFETLSIPQKGSVGSRYPSYVARMLVLAPLAVVIVLLFVRPTTTPFAHMSGSLPFTLSDAWRHSTQPTCQAEYSPSFVPFPMADLIASEAWQPARGFFPGWMPSLNMSSSKVRSLPSWLPKEAIPGFDRWYDGKDSIENSESQLGYDPVVDPLRITNLDEGVFESIVDTVREQKPSIEHVIILNLESTRKDVFPVQKASHLHKMIEKTYHATESSTKELNRALARISTTAELLTGEASGFREEGVDDLEEASRSSAWRNLSKKLGGLNVVGALTGSTSTFKSMLGSHCGVQPLAVDFTVEAGEKIYQPCIPHILNLFNGNKNLAEDGEKKSQKKAGKSTGRIDDMRSRPWRSVFMQSITDKFDHQDELNQNMGFQSAVVKSTLLDPASPRFPPTEEESNYFGFPERQLRPYLRDVLRDAKKKQERLFLSHFTSSTHHPWSLPASEQGKKVDYLKRSGVFQREHELNRYLNTVRYVDDWIGEMMDILEEEKMLEKSLVVVVGDHGMAFEEDAYKHSTFENGHVSNLRVPLVFYHPLLPRIQLQINATSLSILPTILDLLVTTSSLNEQDSEAASHLMHQYEGQSLIRPYRTTSRAARPEHQRQSWNIGVLNAGGGFLSVSSASLPYRLILPVCRSGGAYRFTATDTDPNELYPLEQYSMPELGARVRAVHGGDAVKWLFEAEKVGMWWVLEQRRRWGYTGASLGEDQDTKGERGRGSIRKEHWWNT